MNKFTERLINRLPLLAVGSAAVVACATAAVTSKYDPQEQSKPAAVKLVVDDRPLSRDSKLGTSFAPVVKKVAPSVVKVTTTTKIKQTSLPDFPGSGEPF